jgi:hypothetical protein
MGLVGRQVVLPQTLDCSESLLLFSIFLGLLFVRNVRLAREVDWGLGGLSVLLLCCGLRLLGLLRREKRRSLGLILSGAL